MDTISERLKFIRNEKRFSQAELANLLDITKQAVANVEIGRNNPSIDFISKVANSGMYLYTTDLSTGREVFISNVNVRPDGTCRLSYLNEKYKDIIYTPEELKAMNFTVWGRIVKNLLLTR